MDDIRCKCNMSMELVATEKDYGDTVALVYWCPKCGRVFKINRGWREHVEDVYIWKEPAGVKSGK